MSNKWMPPKPEQYKDEFYFNEWYDKEIRPLFENAVEVYGDGRIDNGFWSPQENDRTINQTHKALLIKIQPIKEETAEDLLREICENQDEISRLEVIKIAKAFLERKKK